MDRPLQRRKRLPRHGRQPASPRHFPTQAKARKAILSRSAAPAWLTRTANPNAGRQGSQLRAGENPERKEEKMEPVQPRTSAKNCPECNQPLSVRTNQNTRKDFLGCTAWPDCHHTEPLPLDMVLRRQGHPELPGALRQQPPAIPGNAPGSRFRPHVRTRRRNFPLKGGKETLKSPNGRSRGGKWAKKGQK